MGWTEHGFIPFLGSTLTLQEFTLVKPTCTCRLQKFVNMMSPQKWTIVPTADGIMVDAISEDIPLFRPCLGSVIIRIAGFAGPTKIVTVGEPKNVGKVFGLITIREADKSS